MNKKLIIPSLILYKIIKYIIIVSNKNNRELKKEYIFLLQYKYFLNLLYKRNIIIP